MYNWMQANRKKMLAIFGVLLMIVFVLPSTPGMFQHQASTGGYIGDEAIDRKELADAYQQWDFIARRLAPIMQQQLASGRAEPWQMALFSDKTLESINRNPELFLLLQREGHRMGVRISEDRVNELLGLLSTMMSQPNSMNEVRSRRMAVENLLLVGGAFDRAASAIKVSRPRVDQEIAEQYQTLTTRLVEFRAEDYLKEVAEPSSEAVRKQIDTYGNVDPANIDEKADPFGFSYRLPDRVKLQSILIPRSAVLQKVEQSQDDFAWRTAAYAEYQQHPARYETVEPATEPSAFGDSPDLSLAATKPAAPAKRLRSFDEVYPQIKADLLRPKVDQKIKQIQDRLASLLQKGYERYQAQKNNTPLPESIGIKADFSSYEFLQQVATQIQKEYGITPTVQSISNRWLSEADLIALPDLGNAMLAGRSMRDSLMLSEYLLSRGEAFRDEQKRKDGDTLSLLQPSAAMVNAIGDVLFVRLTDAQPAHAPASDSERAEVIEQATRDLKLVAAYEKAQQAANAFYEKVKSSSFDDAAAGQKVLTAGPISRMYRLFGAAARVEGYNLSDASRQTFADEAFNLLHEATDENSHPATRIELPRDRRIVIARLDGIDRIPGNTPAEMTARSVSIARLSILIDLAREWFDPQAIKTRLNWKQA